MSFEELILNYHSVIQKRNTKFRSFESYVKIWKERIYKKHYPKHKSIKFDKLISIPEIISFENKMTDRDIYRRVYDFWESKVEKAGFECFNAAQSESPKKTDSFILFDTVSSGTYSTQGYGAISYARRAAEAKGDICAANDIEFEIRKVNAYRTPGPFGQDWCDFEVWAKTDNIGIEILNRKTIPFVEEIRLLLKRGSNIRVHYPYLEMGFEEKIGIDYFGNIMDQNKFELALKRY